MSSSQKSTTNWTSQALTKKPPIPFKANEKAICTILLIIEICNKTNKLVMDQKEKLDIMKASHLALLTSLQQLHANTKAAESESTILRS